MLMNGNGTNQENKKKNAVVLLIAHVLAAAILTAGCSGYDDSKPASDSAREVEMETSDAEITDLTETDDPDLVYSEDTDNTSDDPDAGGHVPVTKVDQITDKVFQNLRAKGEDYFQTSVADTLPDGVTIKDLNYLDIYILKDHEAEEDDENPYVCSLLYQVIFTDETGDAAVEDCFIWISRSHRVRIRSHPAVLRFVAAEACRNSTRRCAKTITLKKLTRTPFRKTPEIIGNREAMIRRCRK